MRRLIASLLFACPVANGAEEPLEWHGFLSAAVTMTDQAYPYSLGTTLHPDYHKHSKLGLNLSKGISHDVTVTAQILARNSKIELEWAFARINLTNWLTIRAGRQNFSVWLYSDRLAVGQAYNWVTPPEETYGQNPIRNINGVSLSVSPQIGSFESQLEVYGGTFREEVESTLADGSKLTIEGEARAVAGSNLAISTEDLTVRAGVARATVSVKSEYYAIKRAEALFWSYGLVFKRNSFEFIAEYAALRLVNDKDGQSQATEEARAASDKAAASGSEYDKLLARKATLNARANNSSYLGGRTGYAMVAWTAGDFTPHLTYAQLDAPDDAFIYGDQQSWTLGVKYDVNLNTAFKIQGQKVDIAEESWGLYSLDYSDPNREYKDLNVYSASLDYVF